MAPTTHGAQSRVGLRPSRRWRTAGVWGAGVGASTSAPEAERMLWTRGEPHPVALVHTFGRLGGLDDDGASGVLAVDEVADDAAEEELAPHQDRKSTRLNSSHVKISYAVFCLKKK